MAEVMPKSAMSIFYFFGRRFHRYVSIKFVELSRNTLGLSARQYHRGNSFSDRPEDRGSDSLPDSPTVQTLYKTPRKIGSGIGISSYEVSMPP